MQGRQGAGRVQGQGTEGENLKITFLQLFDKKGEGRGRAAQGQGQGQG